ETTFGGMGWQRRVRPELGQQPGEEHLGAGQIPGPLEGLGEQVVEIPGPHVPVGRQLELGGRSVRVGQRGEVGEVHGVEPIPWPPACQSCSPLTYNPTSTRAWAPRRCSSKSAGSSVSAVFSNCCSREVIRSLTVSAARWGE